MMAQQLPTEEQDQFAVNDLDLSGLDPDDIKLALERGYSHNFLNDQNRRVSSSH